jgi:hypothetical protein
MHRSPLASALSAAVGLACVSLAAVLPGCGPQPVQGGTAGHLLAAGKPLSDIQVTVFQSEGTELKPVGFAITKIDGSFALLQNQARGPLKLTAGDYRCTLESAGAPVKIPRQFAKPETTPLKVSWSGNGVLDLTLTEKLIP